MHRHRCVLDAIHRRKTQIGEGGILAYCVQLFTYFAEKIGPGRLLQRRRGALLAKTGVASVAAAAFFRPGKGEDLLRFCFAKKDKDLGEGCRRLRTLGFGAQVSPKANCSCRLSFLDNRQEQHSFSLRANLRKQTTAKNSGYANQTRSQQNQG